MPTSLVPEDSTVLKLQNYKKSVFVFLDVFLNVFVYILFDSAAMIAVYTDNNTKAKEEVGETRQIQLSLW